MVGVCSHGVVAAAMPAMEVGVKAAGGGSRSGRAGVAPLQSAFLGNTVALQHRHSKSCAFARRAAVGGVAVAASASGDGGSISWRGPEETVEVFFYSGSAVGQSPAGGRRVKWEIGSVAGAEKEVAASSSEDAPFASWSNLGFNGGKRNDLKKILVLGAGLLADPFSSSCFAFFRHLW